MQTFIARWSSASSLLVSGEKVDGFVCTPRRLSGSTHVSEPTICKPPDFDAEDVQQTQGSFLAVFGRPGAHRCTTLPAATAHQVAVGCQAM